MRKYLNTISEFKMKSDANNSAGKEEEKTTLKN